MINEKLIKEIAGKIDIQEDKVQKVYSAFWAFIKDTIQSIPLKANDLEHPLSEEEFNKFHTNINVPSLGKFYCTYDDYIRTVKHFKRIKNIRNAENKKDKTNVQQDSDNL